LAWILKTILPPDVCEGGAKSTSIFFLYYYYNLIFRRKQSEGNKFYKRI